MKSRKRVFSTIVALAFLFSAGALSSARAEEMMHEHGSDASMQMHHLHMLMNHGLEMVVAGSNLVMLADMKMAPSLDPMTAEHGRAMIKSGREIIEHALKGPEMQAMHKAGHGDAPLMKYTHELANAELSVVDLLEKMNMEGTMTADMMAMHHMHIIMNHALEMAAQGSNMVMLGQMGMAGEIDKYSMDHGKMMLSQAKSMISDVMGGKAMMDMHQKGVTGGNAMMADTHKLGDAEKKVVELLDTMAAAASPMAM